MRKIFRGAIEEHAVHSADSGSMLISVHTYVRTVYCTHVHYGDGALDAFLEQPHRTVYSAQLRGPLKRGGSRGSDVGGGGGGDKPPTQIKKGKGMSIYKHVRPDRSLSPIKQFPNINFSYSTLINNNS